MNLEDSLHHLVVPLPGCVSTAVVWRQSGRWHATIVAKATFAMVHGGELRLIEPEPIADEDIPHQGNPLRSIRIPRDRVPALSRVDVVVNAEAWAPQGAPATTVPVQLTLRSGERVLLDKALIVRADQPFQRLPIVYERAYGGIGAAENPVGTGARDGDNAPNVLHPTSPTTPACFGAIAPHWRSRRALQGSLPKGALRSLLLDLPANLSWDFFQAAPPDQRVERLTGGEEIELKGMSPAYPTLTTRLPQLRGLARIHGLSAHGTPDGQVIALRPDTLRIDADEERCVIGFRGNVLLPDPSVLDRVRVVVGVQIHGAPLQWELAHIAALPLAGGDDADSPASSVTLDEGDVELLDEESVASRASLGKTVALEEMAASPGPAAPLARGASPWRSPSPLDRTITSVGAAPRAQGTLPFQAGSAALIASSPRSRRPKRGVGDTLEVAPGDLDVRPSTPFRGGPRPAKVPAPAGPEKVPVQIDSPPPAAQVRAEPPPPAAPAHAEPAAAAPTRVYAAEPAAAPEPPAPKPSPPRARPSPGRPPSPPSPKAELRKELYGRFGS